MTSETSHPEAEANPSIGSNNLENSSFQLIVEKLNGRNFREWAQSIKLVIEGKGKLGYFIGDTKRPYDAASLQKLKFENSMVIAWLVNSMKPSIGKTYLFLPTTKDTWDVVKETYSNAEGAS